MKQQIAKESNFQENREYLSKTRAAREDEERKAYMQEVSDKEFFKKIQKNSEKFKKIQRKFQKN